MTYYIDTDKYIDNSIVLFTVGYKKKTGTVRKSSVRFY
jgi:hypothetical protein